MSDYAPDRPLPPGPKPFLIGGNILQFRANMLQFLLDSARQYGDLVLFRFHKSHVYMVNHPDYIHELLVKQSHKINKSPVYKKALGKFLGEGLLVSDGEFWKRQRRLAQPAFHTKRIEAYAETMVAYTEDMMSGWRDGESCDIATEMMRLTLFIVAKTLFDADVRADAAKMGDALEVLLHVVVESASRLVPLPRWVPTRARARRAQAIRDMDDIVMRVIEERRHKGDDRGDLLSMLLMAQDEDGTGMSDKQVRDEALTIFLAGHETTANALTWTWYLLSQHPDVEAALHAEVDSVLGGRAPSVADLARLPYTEQVIKEAMRLYPPAWGFSRKTLEDVALDEHWTIPAKRGVLVIPYVVHRDPRWYPDPDRFDPMRWTPEREKALPKMAYLPFGGGPRICIGNNFAMMEARLILAAVAQRYQLRLAPQQKVVPEPLVTLRPKYGLRMALHAR